MEACAKRGVPLPEAIQNAPELLSGLELYYDAFHDLLTCRGMGGPIPWTAMREYSAYLGIEDGGEFRRFVYLMRRMEDELAEFKDKDKPDGS